MNSHNATEDQGLWTQKGIPDYCDPKSRLTLYLTQKSWDVFFDPQKSRPSSLMTLKKTA